LTLASGATALGSVLTVSFLESSTIHCVLLLLIKLNQYQKSAQEKRPTVTKIITRDILFHALKMRS
jgi:hypothetical protein